MESVAAHYTYHPMPPPPQWGPSKVVEPHPPPGVSYSSYSSLSQHPSLSTTELTQLISPQLSPELPQSLGTGLSGSQLLLAAAQLSRPSTFQDQTLAAPQVGLSHSGEFGLFQSSNLSFEQNTMARTASGFGSGYMAPWAGSAASGSLGGISAYNTVEPIHLLDMGVGDGGMAARLPSELIGFLDMNLDQ